MRKLGMRALIGLGAVAVSAATLVSCGGGSGSSAGVGGSSSSSSAVSNTPSNSDIANTPSKLEKNAYLTISVPALAERLQAQILPDDTTKISVSITQYPQVSKDGVICDYSTGSCYTTTEYVTLTPQNPKATVSLFPGYTQICINTASDATSNTVVCGIAYLKTGNNTLNYTLVRGTWTLPSGKDLAGFNRFAIKGVLGYLYEYYSNPALNIIASADGNTWSNIEGAYIQGDYEGGGKFFGFGKGDNTNGNHGFIAIDGNPQSLKVKELGYIYSYQNNSYTYTRVLEESEFSFKLEDKDGKDVTNTLLESCKFASTDGKSITGCLIKNAKKSTQQDYTYKLTKSFKKVGANICYNDRSAYDSSADVCYDRDYRQYYTYNPTTGTYTYEYRCYDPVYTYNSSKQRCEASLKNLCEGRGGTYNSDTKSCVETGTEYYSVGSVERVTLTGSGSLPASGSITVQKK